MTKRQNIERFDKFFKLTGLLPLVILIAASGYITFFLSQIYAEYSRLDQELDKSEILSELSREIYTERSVDAVYMGKNGDLDEEILAKQYARTDAKIKRYQTFQSLRNSEKTKDEKALDEELAKIPALREKVKKLEISFDDMFFGYFQSITSNIAAQIGASGAGNPDSKISPLLAAMSMAFANIDFLSQRRDYIAPAMIQNRAFNNDELTKWSQIKGNSDFYNYVLSDNAVKKKIDRIFADDEYKTTREEAERYIERLSHDPNIYKINFARWYVLLNNEITANYRTIGVLNAEIHRVGVDAKNKLTIHMTLSLCALLLALVLFFYANSSQNRIAKNISELETFISQFERFTKKEEIDFKTRKGMRAAYKNMREALELLVARREKSELDNAEKSAFLVNVSHQLKEPLNAIIGFGELLSETNLQSEQKEYLRIIRESGEKLLERLDKILLVSALESNNVTTYNEEFFPIEEFEDVVNEFANEAAKAGINLFCYVDPTLNRHLKGDVAKVRTVISNLISNAIKFNHRGGCVLFRAERRYGSEENNVVVRFAIKDNGPGFDQNLQIDIFGDSNDVRNRVYGGGGLGLGIVKKYLQFLNSKLHVHSFTGKGSEFNFTLKFEYANGESESHKNEFKGLCLVAPDIDDKCRLPSFDDSKLNTRKDVLLNYCEYLGIDFKFACEPKNKDEIVFSHFGYKGECKQILLSNEESEYENKNLVQIRPPLTFTALVAALRKLTRKDVVSQKTSSKLALNVLAMGEEGLGNMLSSLVERVDVMPDVRTRYDVIFAEPATLNPNQISKLESLSQIFPVVCVSQGPNNRSYDNVRFASTVSKPLTREKLLNALETSAAGARVASRIKGALLLKHTAAAGNIFASAIKGFAKDVDYTTDFKDFEKKLLANPYKIVLADYDVANFDASYFLKLVERAKTLHGCEIKTGIFVNPRLSLDSAKYKQFDLIMSQAISKAQLEQKLRPIVSKQ